MAYGDVYYVFVNSGSTATSAAGVHRLFGGYGGLSDLNAREVFHTQVWANGGEPFRVGTSLITNDSGWRIEAAASVVDLPPMLRTDVDNLHFTREGATDTSANWVIWRRDT